MKTLLVIAGALALAACSKADIQARLNAAERIPGIDFDTKSQPRIVDSAMAHFEFECLDGYLYFVNVHSTTPYISTNKNTGAGEFTKCGMTAAAPVLQANSK